MSIPANRRNITAEELLQHPEWGPCELVEGEVVLVGPTRYYHGEICMNLGEVFAAYRRKVGRGRCVGSDSGIILRKHPDTVRAPDFFFTLDPSRPDGYLAVPPELCVEVLPESDTWRSIRAKVREYLEFGVKLVWVVSPDHRTVHVFRPDGEETVFADTDTLTGEGVLEGLEVRVKDLFDLQEG